MNRKELEIGNRLFQNDPGLMFPLGSDQYEVRLVPEAARPQIQVPHTAHVRISDRIGFELHPDEQLLAMMLSDISTVEELSALDEELRCVALEVALEKALDRIDEISGATSRILRLTSNPSRNPNHSRLYFRLTRKRDGCIGQGFIHADPDSLEWIAGRLGRLSPRQSRRLDRILVPGHIEIGRTTLPAFDINRLEPHDIILAQGACAWSDREIRIRFSPGLALSGSMVQPDRMLIQNIVTCERETMQMTETNDTAAGPDALNVDDIPVKLVFELGRTSITMGELRRIQPGYTIQLDEPAEPRKPVTIMANGIPVGLGEIVRIDDRLGIRVLDFNEEMPPSDKPNQVLQEQVT